MNTPDILTTAQRRVLHLLAQEDLAQQYVLSGGTALAAFHLHHRLSDDLDFFSDAPVDPLRIERFVETVRADLGATDVEPQRIYDRRLFTLMIPGDPPLKLEFTLYPYPHLEEPAVLEGVRVESMRDIAVNKLAAMLDRFEPKDYYDLYILLKDHTDLQHVRTDLKEKFHIQTDPVSLGAAFTRAGNLPVLPHMIQDVSPLEVKQFFVNIAHGLRTETLA